MQSLEQAIGDGHCLARPPLHSCRQPFLPRRLRRRRADPLPSVHGLLPYCVPRLPQVFNSPLSVVSELLLKRLASADE